MSVSKKAVSLGYMPLDKVADALTHLVGDRKLKSESLRNLFTSALHYVYVLKGKEDEEKLKALDVDGLGIDGPCDKCKRSPSLQSPNGEVRLCLECLVAPLVEEERKTKQAACKHPNATSVWSATQASTEHFTCPDCGKRWSD